MGQSTPLRATALIVEDDPMQREMICLLLEESHFNVIECASAEARSTSRPAIPSQTAASPASPLQIRPPKWPYPPSAMIR